MSLPDPVREPDFYRGVAVKRALAWVVDGGVTWVLCLLALPLTAFTGLFWWATLWRRWASSTAGPTIAQGSAPGGCASWPSRSASATGGGSRPSPPCCTRRATRPRSRSFPPGRSVALMAGLGRGQGLTDLALGTAVLNNPS
jgi:hypothetical protein